MRRLGLFVVVTALCSTTAWTQTPEQRLQAWRAQNDFVQRMLGATYDDQTAVAADTIEPVSTAPTTHKLHTATAQLHLDGTTHSRLTSGNALRLLQNSASAKVKFKLVDDAKDTLFVTALMFHCDKGGKALARRLKRAVRRGVDVRLVVDGVGAWAGVGCFQDLQKAGIQVVVSARSLAPTTVDWEMHDKLFIQDGKRAVVGGQNLGSWYFDANGTDDNYRDTDVFVEGPVVRDIARRFVRIWQEQQPLDASLERYVRQLQELDVQDALAHNVGQANYADWLKRDNGRGVCRFVSQDPHKGTFHVFNAYTYLVQHSQRRVIFHALSPEPTGSAQQERLRDLLVRLAARKTARVDVITNGPGLLRTKAMPPQLGSWFGSSFLSKTYEGFKDSNVRVYAYRSYIHSKVFAFDDAAVAIGSFNYDQSGVRCQESALICFDPDLIADVDKMFATDLGNSTHVPFAALPR